MDNVSRARQSMRIQRAVAMPLHAPSEGIGISRTVVTRRDRAPAARRVCEAKPERMRAETGWMRFRDCAVVLSTVLLALFLGGAPLARAQAPAPASGPAAEPGSVTAR